MSGGTIAPVWRTRCHIRPAQVLVRMSDLGREIESARRAEHFPKRTQLHSRVGEGGGQRVVKRHVVAADGQINARAIFGGPGLAADFDSAPAYAARTSLNLQIHVPWLVIGAPAPRVMSRLPASRSSGTGNRS